MKTETKEIYKCDYCNKLYQVKRFAIDHEACCYKNPANKRPCMGCPMMEKKDVTIYSDGPYGQDERQVSVLYCNYKKQFFHTPKNTYKGNAFDLGDQSNEEMPTECDVDLNKELLK